MGVYNRARVDGAVKRAERWPVVKFRRNKMSGFVGVQVNGGMLVREVDGVTMSNVRECTFARSISPTKVIMLSSKRGSYPPAMTSRIFCWWVALSWANASIAKAAFFFFSKRFRDRRVGVSLRKYE